MKAIEIRVPEMGNAVGTTGWVAPKLEQIANTLEVSKTKQGDPCLTYEHWSETKSFSDTTPKRYVLCFITKTNDFDYQMYDNRYSHVWCVKAENYDYQSSYLFPVLSEKAKEIVDDFLDAVCREFWEKYNEA
jgi:hypothetical protein